MVNVLYILTSARKVYPIFRRRFSKSFLLSYKSTHFFFAEDKNIDAYIATQRNKHSDSVPKASRSRPPKDLTVQEKMARKLRTKKGREIYSKRKSVGVVYAAQTPKRRDIIAPQLRTGRLRFIRRIYNPVAGAPGFCWG